MHTTLRASLMVLLAVVAFAPMVTAVQDQPGPRDKFRSGGDVDIDADETVAHDLYVTGGRVHIDGRIQGDLVVAGGSVEVTGPVEGDLAAAGGRVTIRGPVSGDLRVTGGTVAVAGEVREDLLAAAGTFTIERAARVGGDLIFSAADTTLDGAVVGSVLGRGDYRRDPAAAGSGQVPAPGQPPPGSIGGTEDVTEDVTVDDGPTLTERIFSQVRRYIGIVLFGLLLLWLAPRLYGAAATALRERPLRSLGAGVLTLVLGVVLAIGLLIVLIALVLILGPLGFGALLATAVVGVLLVAGLAAFLLVLGASFLAGAVVSIALGRLILDRSAAAAPPTWALLLGALLVVVLTAIPVVGGVVNVAIAVFGLGALAWALWQRRRGDRPAAA